MVFSFQIFVQYWYWFPLSHFLSLAFTPSCLIGLNANLDMPAVKFVSNAKPSTYGYPAPLEEKKKEDREKVICFATFLECKKYIFSLCPRSPPPSCPSQPSRRRRMRRRRARRARARMRRWR